MSDLSIDEPFRLAVDAPDDLNLIIRSHGEIDKVLCEGIAEVLQEPHQIELSRLSFNLKIDLAIAMGLLSKKISPLFKK